MLIIIRFIFNFKVDNSKRIKLKIVKLKLVNLE